MTPSSLRPVLAPRYVGDDRWESAETLARATAPTVAQLGATLWAQAVCYLAASYLEAADASEAYARGVSPAGPVTGYSRTAPDGGSTAVSFATLATDALTSTPSGRAYADLLARAGLGAPAWVRASA